MQQKSNLAGRHVVNVHHLLLTRTKSLVVSTLDQKEQKKTPAADEAGPLLQHVTAQLL